MAYGTAGTLAAFDGSLALVETTGAFPLVSAVTTGIPVVDTAPKLLEHDFTSTIVVGDGRRWTKAGESDSPLLPSSQLFLDGALYGVSRTTKATSVVKVEFPKVG